MSGLSETVLLVSVNAKYIHSCPAIYSLKLFAENYAAANHIAFPPMQIREYTINQPEDYVYYDILRINPQVTAFACYLWNIEYIRDLAADLKAARPKMKIILGGPEVSYGISPLGPDPELADTIICGEGERAFTAWLMENAVMQDSQAGHSPEIPEEWQVTRDGKNLMTMPLRDLSELPFLYEDLKPFENKMIYYESSRGCPFSCAYCLSAGDKKNHLPPVRELSLPRVLKELQYLVDHQVPQIKFVDRTFNCHPSRTASILKWILSLPDEAPTNFHFEIEADILGEELIELLQQAPPGRIQLEIGIQSTYGPALEAVDRRGKTDRLFEHVRRLREGGNLNLHTDLIAGLPKESLYRFKQSFDDVYRLKAHQLQLGFLKLLKGSPMEKLIHTYGYRFSEHPPYEILSNDFISPSEIYELKRVEDAVEKFWNSGPFVRTLEVLEEEWNSPYALFDDLADELERAGGLFIPIGMFELYSVLGNLIKRKNPQNPKALDALLLDYFSYSSSDRLPECVRDLADEKTLFDGPKEKRACADRLLKMIDEKAPQLRYHRIMLRVHGRQMVAVDYSVKDPVDGRYPIIGRFNV